MSHRTRLRTAVIGACTTAVLLAGSGLLALPAQAESPRGPAVTAARADTASEATVRQFFKEYKAAQENETDKRPIRNKYLTRALQDRLLDWAQTTHEDPVFRRNDVPESWSLVQTGEADGRAKITLTETWDSGTTTDVKYEVIVATQMIDELTD
ncbi:hypothetical protein [Streptomyces sp. PvR034]|uniref:hypothetical protein n=1 Tax=Streptomyces sp. PvR034 TaxID=3156401 RepID=UPI003398318A